jgi:hypothetical protein
MLCSPAQPLYTLTWKHQSLYRKILSSFLSFFFPSSYASFHTFISERDCTPLQCFYKGCIQSNQLALSRLMHNIPCSNAIFPYQVLERRPAQKTLIRCAGLHKNSKAVNIYPVLNCSFGLRPSSRYYRITFWKVVLLSSTGKKGGQKIYLLDPLVELVSNLDQVLPDDGSRINIRNVVIL